MTVVKSLSRSQTGVDCGAYDAALAAVYPYDGWSAPVKAGLSGALEQRPLGAHKYEY
jgi:hypothetical protein